MSEDNYDALDAANNAYEAALEDRIELETKIDYLEADAALLKMRLEGMERREVTFRSEIDARDDFIRRLMQELSKHGWGDFHYGPVIQQDRDIVALLEEGGFQYERIETIDINTEPNVFERHQSTMETRPGSECNDGTGTIG